VAGMLLLPLLLLQHGRACRHRRGKLPDTTF
jgi:hypothetical protein